MKPLGEKLTSWNRYFILNNLLRPTCQGRQKESVDGQAQLDVGGKAVNIPRTKRAVKFWT